MGSMLLLNNWGTYMKREDSIRFNIHTESFLESLEDVDLVNLYDKVRAEVEKRHVS